MLRTRLTGNDLLNDPRLNKGTAFTEDERDRFALHGLLPPHVGTLADQVARRRSALGELASPFARYRFLRDLQDANETLFYALLQGDIEALLPVVYTPTVGEGCQRFSEIWHKPRGLFLSYPNRDRIGRILAHPRYDGVRCVVVSDGERVLGLGDQGAGGMGIPIGKLALYTALGGIRPETCLPIQLDVGTDNAERLADPLYIGWGHERVRGAAYDDFVERFVAAAIDRWPDLLLQWEDFAGDNATRLLARYRDRLCTFNDDIQGTAAVAAATLLAAARVSGTPLSQHRIVIFGFGAAGRGIADLVTALLEEAGLGTSEARRRIYAVDRQGLLVAGSPAVGAEQAPWARARSEVAEWELASPGEITLADVIRNSRPTTLIGVSGQPGSFTEPIVRAMAATCERPAILALSNPTSRSEAAPQQLSDWSDGRALIAAGSPFPPVVIGDRELRVTQTNNSYIFPGLALGIIATRALRVSDGMIRAATRALAGIATRGDSLLPPLSEMRNVSRIVGAAVGAQAVAEGLARPLGSSIAEAIAATGWDPVYEPYSLEAGPS